MGLKILRNHANDQFWNQDGSTKATVKSTPYMMEKVRGKGGRALFVIFGSNLAGPHHNGRFDFREEDLVTDESSPLVQTRGDVRSCY